MEKKLNKESRIASRGNLTSAVTNGWIRRAKAERRVAALDAKIQAAQNAEMIALLQQLANKDKT